ncbi:hypothetical protein ACX9NE_02855 [Mycobacterium sp. ML4]
MNALAISLQTYFATSAPIQRDVAANTIASYRDTWRMLLKYLTTTLRIPADALDFDVVTAAHVTGFIDHLASDSGALRSSVVDEKSPVSCGWQVVVSDQLRGNAEGVFRSTPVGLCCR